MDNRADPSVECNTNPIEWEGSNVANSCDVVNVVFRNSLDVDKGESLLSLLSVESGSKEDKVAMENGKVGKADTKFSDPKEDAFRESRAVRERRENVVGIFDSLKLNHIKCANFLKDSGLSEDEDQIPPRRRSRRNGPQSHGTQGLMGGIEDVC